MQTRRTGQSNIYIYIHSPFHVTSSSGYTVYSSYISCSQNYALITTPKRLDLEPIKLLIIIKTLLFPVSPWRLNLQKSALAKCIFQVAVKGTDGTESINMCSLEVVEDAALHWDVSKSAEWLWAFVTPSVRSTITIIADGDNVCAVA